MRTSIVCCLIAIIRVNMGYSTSSPLIASTLPTAISELGISRIATSSEQTTIEPKILAKGTEPAVVLTQPDNIPVTSGWLRYLVSYSQSDTIPLIIVHLIGVCGLFWLLCMLFFAMGPMLAKGIKAMLFKAGVILMLACLTISAVYGLKKPTSVYLTERLPNSINTYLQYSSDAIAMPLILISVVVFAVMIVEFIIHFSYFCHQGLRLKSYLSSKWERLNVRLNTLLLIAAAH